ncbi:hypothetical protein [Lactococcus garvieae]|uniref:hypothetical protein n=1 Tax=Lactococcus garvieae TaxID=1363 RepID=UPI0023EB85F4|nr:hypothetical protein [Lactococcus garvieae]
MQNYTMLNDKELKDIIGGAVTPPKGAFPHPEGPAYPYDMAMGGTTFPHNGSCPSGSHLVGYIGGGQNLCRKS